MVQLVKSSLAVKINTNSTMGVMDVNTKYQVERPHSISSPTSSETSAKYLQTKILKISPTDGYESTRIGSKSAIKIQNKPLTIRDGDAENHRSNFFTVHDLKQNNKLIRERKTDPK
ncbi:hypothetical protein AVEN_28140-1 [Araneus ventricosus]|uniref:Uncharacterized protein n=1 Tax=Araneus ventricosus TaxID=182803 RepID=A0A4Y2GEB8_ARAVE|nr:hypothetical protein AVEN_28140-1 [Araneus ventricosus]